MRRPLGQHFLFDPNLLKKIVRCGEITRNDTVVEIGPGLGTMTKVIAGLAKQVVAIEKDKKLITRLEENLSETNNVEIIAADALKYPYQEIKGSFKVVANLPYYITTPVIFRLLDFKGKVSSMTLLVQKEVAKRIVASPGSKDYGVLSISLQMYTRPVLAFTVSKKAFSPPPSVDSAVLHIDVSSKPIYAVRDEALFSDIVKKAFSQRRKTIVNSLKTFTDINMALYEAGIDPKLRPENLSIDDFVRIAHNLGQA